MIVYQVMLGGAVEVRMETSSRFQFFSCCFSTFGFFFIFRFSSTSLTSSSSSSTRFTFILVNAIGTFFLFSFYFQTVLFFLRGCFFFGSVVVVVVEAVRVLRFGMELVDVRRLWM